MKKSLITLAVASGLLASGAAVADTTVYGLAQVEIASYGSDAKGVAVVDNANGRVGVKSSEDLGEGMKALAKFEYKADTADGAASDASCSVSGAAPATAGGTVTCKDSGAVGLTPRETMVGLKTGMGTVELGRLKSAYKYFGGVAYDPFVATVLEARGNGGMTAGTYGQSGFISDSFAYDNAIGAISFRLTYDFDNGGPNADNKANGMTFGFKFDAGDYEVVFALADDGEETSSSNGNYKSVKLGGQADLKTAGKISIQLEKSTVDTGTSVDVNTQYIDYQFGIDKSNIIDASIGKSKADVSGAEGTNFTRVAFTHKLSKETSVWIGYRSSDDKDAVNKVSVTALGMKKTF